MVKNRVHYIARFVGFYRSLFVILLNMFNDVTLYKNCCYNQRNKPDVYPIYVIEKYKSPIKKHIPDVGNRCRGLPQKIFHLDQ